MQNSNVLRMMLAIEVTISHDQTARHSAPHAMTYRLRLPATSSPPNTVIRHLRKDLGAHTAFAMSVMCSVS